MRTSSSRAVAVTVVAVAGIVGLGGGLVAARIGHQASSQAVSRTPQSSSPGPPHRSVPKGAAPLYYADEIIYDGTRRIPFRPQYGAIVSTVARTAAGWLVFELIGQAGGRLVLVGRDGRAVPIETPDALYFDLSPRGDAVAVPQPGGSKIQLIDSADGSVIETVTTSLAYVGQVRFAVKDLIFNGYTAGGKEEIVRYDSELDVLPTLHLDVPAGSAALVDVSADGRYLVAEYLSQVHACIAVFDLQGSPQPLWSSCAVSSASGSSISPDGTRVIVFPSSQNGEPATGPTIVDLKTGRPSGTLQPEPRSRVAWVDSGHVLVANPVDRGETAFTVSECALGDGSCTYLPGATVTNPASEVAVGPTF